MLIVDSAFFSQKLNKSNRCPSGRIGNEVKIFSGPTTVMGSFIEYVTGLFLGRPIEMIILSQETCLFTFVFIDDGKVCSLFAV